MTCAIRWAGEDLVLLRELALWWPRERTLFIADPHFGKAATFRSVGIPVPELAHADDLARLESIVDRHRAGRLVVLGDFFHARTGRTAATLEALAAWRERQRELEIVLVLGNHDRHAGQPPADWKIACVCGPHVAAPFVCQHEPQPCVAAFALSGHIHPSYRIGDGIGRGLGGPCFHFGERVATLPAFGTFTGTHRIRPDPGDLVFIAGPDGIVDVSRTCRVSRRERPRRRNVA